MVKYPSICTSYSRTTSSQIATHHLLTMCLSTSITFLYSQQKLDFSEKNKFRKRGFQFKTTSSIAVTPVKEKEKKKVPYLNFEKKEKRITQSKFRLPKLQEN